MGTVAWLLKRVENAMASNSGPEIDSIQSRLKELIEYTPEEGVDWVAWRERVLEEVCAPLETFGGNLAGQGQQIEALQAANQALAEENALLRARLADPSRAEMAAAPQEPFRAFHSLAENSPDVLIRLDHDLRHLYVNPAFCRVAGLPPEALLGRSVQEVAVYRAVEKDLPRWSERLLAGKEVRQELEIPINGRLLCFDLRIVPEFNDLGQVETFLVVARDITHHKAVESALRSNEARFRLAASLVGLGLFEQDLSLAYTWRYSPVIQDEWENPAAGKRDADLYPRETAEMLERLKRGVLESGQGMRRELMIDTFDGRRWLDVVFEPLRGPDGAMRGLMGCSVDITQRRLLEEENLAHEASLERQRALLEAIFEIDPGGLAVVSGPEGVYRLANAAYRAALPHPNDDLIGSRLDAIWTETEGFEGMRLIRSVLDEQASVTIERLRRRYPDGTERVFTLHARPLIWEGQPGALLALWEVTQLEDALAAARTASEEARRRSIETEEGRRLLGTLMDYIPEGIMILAAKDLRVRYLSNYFAGDGIKPRDFIGQTFQRYTRAWRLFHPETQVPLAPEEYPAMRAVTRGEIIQDEDYILETADGRRINLLVNAAPIHDNDGRIFASVVASRDITERKRNEANQRFLNALSRDLVGMFRTDEVLGEVARRLGEYLHASRCFISLEDLARGNHTIRLDYASGGLPSAAGTSPLGDPLPRVYERLSQGRTVMVADLRHDPLTAGEYARLFAPLGIQALAAAPVLDYDERWAETVVVASQAPRVWRPDEIVLVQSVADLVGLALESTRLFEDLQEFRNRFDVVLRNAPIIVYTTDSDLHVNWIYHPRHGFSESQGLDQTLERLVSPGAFEALVDVEKSVMESGQGVRRELHVPIQDEMTSHDVTVEPLRDSQGAIQGLTVAVMENTDLRRMEAEALRNQTRIEIQRRLIAEREIERTRIARELHDGPLQDMIAATYALVDAMTINDKETRVEKMTAIREMLQKQVQQLRQFCNDLRPPVLAPFGLEKTIRSHVDGLQALHPEMQITLDLDHDGQRLPEEIRMTLFRIYQELMNNVLRHASASAVSVHFHLTEDRAELEMEDNGKGFATPASWLDYARTGHLGLMGVQERIEMVGGHVDIRSAVGQGTRVAVTLPLR